MITDPNPKSDPKADIQVVFSQFRLPPLEDGHFTLKAVQTVSIDGLEVESFQTTQEFEVSGPRFTLPPEDVHSVFPPNGAQGEFALVLPHVVLSAPTLPWQREPASRTDPKLAAGAVATWLAVLVFDQNDPVPKPQMLTRAQLVSSGPLLCADYPQEFGESPDDPVTVIDLPLELFNRLAPSLEDLTLNASVRLVETSQKAFVGDAVPTSEYAMVFGTRLPVPGNKATAHLVSLENWGAYLPAADGHASARLGQAVETVRLVTLKSWDFTAFDLKQNFTGIMKDLDHQTVGLQRPYTAPASRSLTSAEQQVQDAFAQGYMAFEETLRDGSNTVSWYRGPLLPLSTTPTLLPPYAGSDQLQVYDPATGMSDVSYAAAWQLGRLLALHDVSYAAALARWKLSVSQEQASQQETAIIEASLPVLADDDPVIDALSAPAEITSAVHQRLRRGVLGLVGPAVQGLLDAADAVKPERAATALSLGERIRAVRADNTLTAGLEKGLGGLGDTPAPVGSDLEQVMSWLTRLHMLRGVPFNYLVPDVAMLPAESIRFFQVDGNWMEALIDGAFSPGFTPGNHAQQENGLLTSQAQLHADLRDFVGARAKQRSRTDDLRQQALGKSPSSLLKNAPMPEVLSGFVLRSAAVAGWPGMEVHPFADKEGKHPLPLVRLEIIGTSVLLCLIAGLPQRIDIQEPGEAMHFGVAPGAQSDTWNKSLRWANSTATVTVGSYNGVELTVAPRNAAHRDDRVLSLPVIARAMAQKIWPDPARAGTLTAAQMALEMVEGVERVRFDLEVATGRTLS